MPSGPEVYRRERLRRPHRGAAIRHTCPMPGLQDLGWLQFERLCALVLEDEVGIAPAEWSGSADRTRVITLLEPLQITGRTLTPPVTIQCGWLRSEQTHRELRLAELGRRDGSCVTFVNAPAQELPPSHVVYGEAELLEAVERSSALRLKMPSLLALGAPPPAAGSTLDLDAALALAPVFVPTGAWEQTLARLRAHHFAVLSGPPEMGKTAIARMLALALMRDGWEAHECTRPEQVWERLTPGRRQLFIADDAFGSTEYRPDSAERWARELDGILHATGPEMWLIWTSRPAPLHAGLRRIHRERGAERFPSPGEVLVDASALSIEEKTLILFRHARAADLRPEDRRFVRMRGAELVGHPHFTPERIRRFVACGDDAVLGQPTEAMAASYAALEHEHRELLLAMLDSPPGPVAERDLAAALRRHASTGLPKAPVELVDRLSDHFLRVIA